MNELGAPGTNVTVLLLPVSAIDPPKTLTDAPKSAKSVAFIILILLAMRGSCRHRRDHYSPPQPTRPRGRTALARAAYCAVTKSVAGVLAPLYVHTTGRSPVVAGVFGTVILT